MKKRIAMLIVIVAVLCSILPTTAIAEERAIEIPPADEIVNADFAEAFTMERSTLTGSAKITKMSSTSAKCYGVSEISPSNTQLEVKIVLQQYKDGTWNNYKSASKVVVGTKCELTKTFDVASGYYYRVKTTHKAVGETMKSATTKGILF